MRKTVQQWLNGCEGSKLHDPYFPEGDIEMGLVLFDDGAQMFRIYQGASYGGTYDMSADRILSGGGMLDFLFQVHGKE